MLQKDIRLRENFMAKSRPKKFVCSECGDAQLVWEGFCRACGKVGTYKETGSVTSQKTVRRRWKRNERETARSMLIADGPDPLFNHIASSTGKVGHITGLRFDAVSRTYTTEDKNRDLPIWIINAWILIQQRATDLKKNALIHITPPNMPKTFKLNGETFKTGSMAVITQDHHLDLVRQARILYELEQIIFSNKKYEDLQEELWRLKER